MDMQSLSTMLIPATVAALGWFIQYVLKLSSEFKEYKSSQDARQLYITEQLATIKESINKLENNIKEDISNLKVDTKQVTTENKTNIEALEKLAEHLQVDLKDVTGGVTRRFKALEPLIGRVEILEQFARDSSPVMKDIIQQTKKSLLPQDSYDTFTGETTQTRNSDID